MEAQIELTQKQLEQIDRQNIENLFFKLLDLKSTSLRLYEYRVAIKGRDERGFDAMVWNVKNGEDALRLDFKDFYLVLCHLDMNTRGSSEYIDRIHKIFYKHIQHIKSIVNIIFLIENSNFSLESKNQYTQIFLSSLSSGEKNLIFYFIALRHKKILGNIENISIDIDVVINWLHYHKLNPTLDMLYQQSSPFELHHKQKVEGNLRGIFDGIFNI